MDRKTKIRWFLLVLTVAMAAVVGFLFVNVVQAEAATVHASATWTYNGNNTTGGFIIEKQDPGQSAWVEVVRYDTVSTRMGAFDFTPLEGRTNFRLVAFTGTERSGATFSAYEYSESTGSGLVTPGSFYMDYTVKP